MNRSVLVFLFVMLLLVPIGAADSYSVSTDKIIDVPERDRTIDGETFEITNISQIEQNNTLTVMTSGPDSRYDVNLITPQGQFARVEQVSDGGDATIEFDMSRPPGSWRITITDPQELVVIHPVIVKAYTVSPNVSETTVTSGTDVTADITVTEPDGGVSDQKDINRVEAVLANESTEVRVTAEAAENAENTYRASISTDNLTTGSYEFFGVVRGNQDIRGQNEVLGISTTTNISVEQSNTDTTTQSSNGGNSDGPSIGGGGGGGVPADTTTESPSTSIHESVTETGSTSVSPQRESDTEPVITASETPTSTVTPTSTATDASAITPTTGSGTETSTPGFTPVILIVSLVALVMFALRRL